MILNWVLTLALLLLTGCGFQPMLEKATCPLKRFSPDMEFTVPHIQSFDPELSKHFELDFRRAAASLGINPNYKLKVSLSSSEDSALISQDATIGRLNYTLVAHYTLSLDSKLITQGSVASTGALNIDPNQAFASTSSKRRQKYMIAQELAHQLAEEILLIQSSSNP